MFGEYKVHDCRFFRNLSWPIEAKDESYDNDEIVACRFDVNLIRHHANLCRRDRENGFLSAAVAQSKCRFDLPARFVFIFSLFIIYYFDDDDT